MKGKYDSNECSTCGEEDENQEHVINCNVLLQMNPEYDMKVRDYKLILHGNVDQQLQISRLFKSNMKILQKLKNEK